jgi:hypothetical protein
MVATATAMATMAPEGRAGRRVLEQSEFVLRLNRSPK